MQSINIPRMRISLKIIIAILLLNNQYLYPQSKYWEDLSEKGKNELLNDENTYKIAIDFYYGKFNASDDSATFEMLDSLTKKPEFNPLYFYLFNKMLSKADGALAEVMADYCFYTLINNPVEVINYFTRNRLAKSSNLVDTLYADFLGWEFKIRGYIGEQNEMRFKDLKEFLENMFKNDSKENIETIKLFLKEIERVTSEIK